MSTALRSFTPPPGYRPFVVTLLRTIYDEDAGRISVHVNAIGPANAKQLAIEQLRDRYPDAFALRAVPECPGCTHDSHDTRCIIAGCDCAEVAVMQI